MIPASYKRLVYLRYYIISVAIAAAVLIAARWESIEGVWSALDVISQCIWQAIVWPLYLIKVLLTP